MTPWSPTGSSHGFDVIMDRLVPYSGLDTWRGIVKPSFKGPNGRLDFPKSIAGLEVTSVVDLTLGYDSTNPPSFKPSLPLSSGHMIQFRAASKDGLKIVLTIRTSGTEPKVRVKGMLKRE
jgi:hypothetical protein